MSSNNSRCNNKAASLIQLVRMVQLRKIVRMDTQIRAYTWNSRLRLRPLMIHRHRPRRARLPMMLHRHRLPPATRVDLRAIQMWVDTFRI